MTRGDTEAAGWGRTLANRNPLERLIVASDGTVTPMLEQLTGEPVATARLAQVYEPADEGSRALLGVPANRPVLIRNTQLRGAVSGRVFVEARSVIDVDALTADLRTGLLYTDEPIGRLLRRQRVEAFREVVSIEAPTEDRPDTTTRQYLIFIGSRPAFLIREWFHFAALVDLNGGD